MIFKLERTTAGILAMESVPGAIATGLQASLLDQHEMLILGWDDTDIPDFED